jgi:nucleoside-diphosphate-sugar epimerase
VARVLIVGCGCRGQALARELRAAGHAVRGTTRDPANAAAIAATGAEPYVGDPDRIGTLMEALTGVTIVCWLMGAATGPPEQVAALHDGRLRMLWEKLVDTPVRGVVHEAAGPLSPEVLARGRAVAEAAHATWRIPLVVLDADPADHDAWRAAAAGAVAGLLGAPT